MFQYIARDFKTALHRRYTYAYVIGIFALCLIANIAVVAFRMVYGTNEGTYAYNILNYTTWCFVVPYYSCMFIADMGFGKVYPNPQIKDKITKNMSRTAIYFSKLITELLLGLLFLVIAFVLLIGITAVFHFADGTVRLYDVKDFVGKMLIAIPLWGAGVSFGNMFLFLFEDKKKAYAGYYVLTLLVPRLIMALAAEPVSLGPFRFLRRYLISQGFGLLPYPADPERNVALIVTVAIIYGLIACVVGAAYYHKKQVKY